MNVAEIVAATRYAPGWFLIVIVAGFAFVVLSMAFVALKRR